MVGVICDKTKVKVLELGDKLVEETMVQRQAMVKRISELTSKDRK